MAAGDRAGGGAAGVATAAGVEEAAARELNAPFVHALASDRPFVTLKLAVSLDGAIADHTRRPGWLTTPASRRLVHRLRANADAVAVASPRDAGAHVRTTTRTLVVAKRR